jgi:hypothetical protein
MTKANRISRRTVLRGMGAAVALPWLEAMLPRAARGAPANAGPPRRMALFFVPNGVHMPDWKPAKEGPLTDPLPPILAPLSAHKQQITVLTEMTLDGGRAHSDGPGDHARNVASYLTGAHPKKTSGKDIYNGISVDQVAAQKVGHLTRFPSLELGTQPSSQGGRCDSGYSCVYTSNMSWRTATSPMTKETNPRAVFDRLFATNETADDRKAGSKRDQYRKSILDFVSEDTEALSRKLGTADRRKLDEYLYAVRQIERRIDQSEKIRAGDTDIPVVPRPVGTPKDFGEHVHLMMDMMVLAFQTDATRIVTFMYTNAGDNRSYNNVGVNQGHHSLSHHGNDPKKLSEISKINRYHTTLLTHFLDRMTAVREGDGTLLDNSLVQYGSGIGDGNRHNHDDLPILLIGRGGGTIVSGQHRRYPDDTPLTNLYLAMLDRMAAPTEKLADSTGPLEGLA